ncbi:MAG: 30S ribosomal protein S4 [Nanobdellota archaeon]
MGQPKRIRRKYDTPIHPWIKSRIDDEKRLAKTYGTKNKKEIWRMETVLKKFKSQAKHLIAATGDQAEIEKEHLLRRVKNLGLAGSDVNFDKILGMSIDNVMERRLQTVVFKKGLARSVKQARQFITHEHILVDGKTITSPAYLVTVAEEAQLEFSPSSSLYSEEHPERGSPETKENAKAKAPKMEEEKAESTVVTEDKSDDSSEKSEEQNADDEKTEKQKADVAAEEQSEEKTQSKGENK